MQTKLIKRMASLVLSCVIVAGISTTAFATKPTKHEETTKNEVSVMADVAVTGTAPAWGTGILRPHLSSYIGFSKTIRITTQSTTDNGGVDIELKKNGELKSDGNWWMGTNDVGEWKLTLPSSGDYELLVHNKSGAPVYITAQWL